MRNLGEYIQKAMGIRRRVRLESGRSDGRCGKVAEALEKELDLAYRWGHLRLLDGGICWIHCWNELPDGTILDATADQFQERWPGDLVVLPPNEVRYSHYRPAPPGHQFRTVRGENSLRLYAREISPCGDLEQDEHELAEVYDTPGGWALLGACAIEIHSGDRLVRWIAEEAGELLQAAARRAHTLMSREMEFVLDAADRRRRIAEYGEWTSPEWRESHAV